jgi:hypothetical protein
MGYEKVRLLKAALRPRCLAAGEGLLFGWRADLRSCAFSQLSPSPLRCIFVWLARALFLGKLRFAAGASQHHVWRCSCRPRQVPCSGARNPSPWRPQCQLVAEGMSRLLVRHLSPRPEGASSGSAADNFVPFGGRGAPPPPNAGPVAELELPPSTAEKEVRLVLSSGG